MSNCGFLIQLDPTPHSSKPEGVEIAAITRRLQQVGPSLVTFEELRDAIIAGATWCGGCFEPRAGGWGPFVSQQLFALDVDNDAEYRRKDGSKGKRPLLPDEVGYLSTSEALERCASLGLEPMLIHYTMHHDSERNVRYRLIFDAGEPVTNEARAGDVLKTILSVFPEADERCANVNRLFFGGSEVIDCRSGRWLP